MSWLSKLFGGGGREPDPYTGVKPYSSLTQFPVGKKLNEVILAGLGGEGWGYGPDYVSRITNPAIAQREAGFREQELPFLSAQLSGRGIGRSTQAADILQRQAAQKERDISSMIANAYQQELAQRKADEARYQNLGMGYAGQEVGTRGGAAQFDLNQWLQEQNLRNQYAQSQGAGLQNLISGGIGALGGILAPATGGASLVGASLGQTIGSSLLGAGGLGSTISPITSTMSNYANTISVIDRLLAARGGY